ncbi:MAG: hypothetical protein A2054_01615 [Deltaproteobacteria bacterium GWA2_55_10]|nr:MAG: hypothetical protein A2054_01615 [Deltaproteobacteria bacterium GWA2_55_10]
MRLKAADRFLYRYVLARKSTDRRSNGVGLFRPEEVRNILVVSSTAIGDTLLSTPAIRAVRKAFPKARIVALLNAANMELFSNNPNIAMIVPYHGGYSRFFRTISELKKYELDLAFILHGNEPQATPMCYLSGARFIFKLPNDSEYNFLLSNREPVLGWGDFSHGIEARLATAALAGVAADGPRMELFIEDRDREAAREFLRSEGVSENDILAGFQPGASTLSRQWFPERFIELGKKLTASYPGLKIVLTGSPAERALCERIRAGIGEGVIDSAGRLPLRQVPPLIESLSAFVTGDTGPMHISIAVGTPIVALYAVADHRKTGPLVERDRHVIIQKPRTCDPCVSKRCAYQKCMEAISVDEVFEAVEKVLRRRIPA